MSATDISPYNTAHAVWLALDAAETALSPSGSCSSRLFVAIRLADATVSYLANDTEANRLELLERLDDVFRVQGVGRLLENLHPESLIARGLNASIHISQAALINQDPSEYVLGEARFFQAFAAELEATA